MKKRFIVLCVLSLLLILLVACTPKKKTSKKEENPYKNFKTVTNSNGITYKVPKSWNTPDSNSDDVSLYYKNDLGDNDGLLSVAYFKFDGNVLDSKNIEKLKNSIKKYKDYKDDLQDEYTQINNIDMEIFYYNTSIDDMTYKEKMIVFPVKHGYFTFTMQSFPANNYSNEFDKILEAIKIDSDFKPDKKSITYQENTAKETTTEETTEKLTTTESTTEEYKSKLKSKDITEKDINFQDEYRNDSTGKWRLATTSDSFDIQKYALSYYYNYFKSDDEIHILVNFTRMTTTRMAVAGNVLDVSIHEYTKGEEHDANKALSGILLNEYHVNMDTGKISKIQ